MQSSIDCQRVIDIGADPKKVLLTGNMKFEQKISFLSLTEKENFLKELNLNSEKKIFIAGSTHAGEEEMRLEIFQELLKNNPHLVLIIAPRHPERFSEVEKLVKKRSLSVTRKTQIQTDSPPSPTPQVILLDTIGELARTYNIGDLIFVGGSLVNIGGHNILEPLIYKKPVLFGPYMQNFSEIAQALQDSGAGILVNSKEELLTQAERLLADQKAAQALGEKGFQILKVNQGATEKNMEMINKFIRNRSREPKGSM